MSSLPPIPDRPSRGPGLPPIGSPDAATDGRLPPLTRPARQADAGTASRSVPPVVERPRRRPPALGRGTLVAAAVLAAAGLGGLAGASFVERSDSPAPVVTQAAPATAQAPGATPSLSDAVRVASPSVVAVRSSSGQGSGVIVEDRGLVVTNHHVVVGDGQVGVETADGRLVSADVVATDPEQDLAVLRPVSDVGSGARIAVEPNGGLSVGDQVFAIGSPFGLRNTVTSGIVSFVDRPPGLAGTTPMIQTDAPINPGNSGGGLFDLRGQLVGIPTSIRAPIQGNVGIGFAVPASRVSALLQRVQ